MSRSSEVRAVDSIIADLLSDLDLGKSVLLSAQFVDIPIYRSHDTDLPFFQVAGTICNTTVSND